MRHDPLAYSIGVRGGNARRVLPERLGTGGVQIAAREPDIREHSIVEVGKERELSAMFESDYDPPGASRQRGGSPPDRRGRADRTRQFGEKVRSPRNV